MISEPRLICARNPQYKEETLMLAAKVAGIAEYLGAWYDDGTSKGFLCGRLGSGRSVWNAWENDGDAFFLMSELRISIRYSVAYNVVYATCEAYPRACGCGYYERGEGKQAATRHAIVLAASVLAKESGYEA